MSDPLIITVDSGKGGVGKTMIAAAIANQLALKTTTLLIDFDFNNRGLTGLLRPLESPGAKKGTVAAPSFMIPARGSNAETLEPNTDRKNPSSSPNSNWSVYRAKQRLFFLSYGDLTPEELDAIEDANLEDLISSCRSFIKKVAQELKINAVVIDCHGGPDQVSFAASSVATYSFLVSEPDRISMYGTLNFIRQRNRHFESPPENVYLIFNKATTGYSAPFVESVYDRFLRSEFNDHPLLAVIPFQEYLASASETEPFITSVYPSAMFTRKINLVLHNILKNDHAEMLPRDMRYLPNLYKNWIRRSLGRTPIFLTRDTVLPVLLFTGVFLFVAVQFADSVVHSDNRLALGRILQIFETHSTSDGHEHEHSLSRCREPGQLDPPSLDRYCDAIIELESLKRQIESNETSAHYTVVAVYQYAAQLQQDTEFPAIVSQTYSDYAKCILQYLAFRDSSDHDPESWSRDKTTSFISCVSSYEEVARQQSANICGLRLTTSESGSTDQSLAHGRCQEEVTREITSLLHFDTKKIVDRSLIMFGNRVALKERGPVASVNEGTVPEFDPNGRFDFHYLISSYPKSAKTAALPSLRKVVGGSNFAETLTCAEDSRIGPLLREGIFSDKRALNRQFQSDIATLVACSAVSASIFLPTTKLEQASAGLVQSSYLMHSLGPQLMLIGVVWLLIIITTNTTRRLSHQLDFFSYKNEIGMCVFLLIPASMLWIPIAGISGAYLTSLSNVTLPRGLFFQQQTFVNPLGDLLTKAAIIMLFLTTLAQFLISVVRSAAPVVLLEFRWNTLFRLVFLFIIAAAFFGGYLTSA